MRDWDEEFEEFFTGEEGVDLRTDMRTEETLRIADEFLRNVQGLEAEGEIYEGLKHALAVGMQIILGWPVDSTETHAHYCDDHADFAASIDRLRKLNGLIKEEI